MSFPRIMLALLFTLVGVIYLPVFTYPLVPRHDDMLIAFPLKSVTGLGDYLDKIRTGVVFDVQPVRDLWVMMDNWGEAQVHPLFFYASALLLFSGILWASWGVLSAGGLQGLLLPISVLLIATHPLFTQVIPWNAAKKHLLSTFFILLATRAWLKSESKGAFWYTLAGLTQPIHLAWPAVFLPKFFTEKKFSRPLITVSTLALLIASLNLWYYRVVYPAAVKAEKITGLRDATTWIMGIGRSAWQIFFPTDFAFDYDVFSTLHFAGIALLVLWHALLFKKIEKTRAAQIVALFWGPLIVTNIFNTNIFVSDSYLILPLVAVVLGIALIVQVLNLSARNLMTVSGVVILAYTLLSVGTIRRWRTPRDFWIASYEQEPTCLNGLQNARQLWTDEKLEEAILVGEDLRKNQCFVSGSSYGEIMFNVWIMEALHNPLMPDDLRSKIISNSSTPGANRQLLLLLANKNFSQLPEITRLKTELKLEWSNSLFLSLRRWCKDQDMAVCSAIVHP